MRRRRAISRYVRIVSSVTVVTVTTVVLETYETYGVRIRIEQRNFVLARLSSVTSVVKIEAAVILVKSRTAN